MQCPRCQCELREMESAGVKLDVCYGGCGGIWFDEFELKKLEQKLEATEDFFTQLANSKTKNVDHGTRVNCPKCKDIVMMRHFYSTERSVEVDQCPQCGGFWLDAGELTQIHRMFPSEEERRQAAQKVFSDLVDNELAKMRAESEEQLSIARKIGHALRFISPSYYLKGKKDWSGL